jgi:hypothetical protein
MNRAAVMPRLPFCRGLVCWQALGLPAGQLEALPAPVATDAFVELQAVLPCWAVQRALAAEGAWPDGRAVLPCWAVQCALAAGGVWPDCQALLPDWAMRIVLAPGVLPVWQAVFPGSAVSPAPFRLARRSVDVE